MDLVEYEERLNAHNWCYQNYHGKQWIAGHKEYETLIRLSTTTPAHRRLFLLYKKERLPK